MKVAVIGAGIAGVATAYELVAEGHAVTVLDQHSSIAAESSFAPTGLFGAGWWALAPKAEGRLTPLNVALLHRPALWPWWWRLKQSTAATAVERRLSACVPMALQSQSRLQELISQLRIEVEQSCGALILWRDAAERARAQPVLTALRALGLKANELEPAGCHALEPQLDADQPLVGGVHLPDAGAGNCRQIAHALRDAAEHAGVEWRFATTVRALTAEPGGGVTLHLEQAALTTAFGSSRLVPAPVARPIPAARTRAAARYLAPVTEEHYDAVVIATGASTNLLQSLGLRIPMAPVHGYSLTAQLRSSDRGPRSVVIDAAEGAVIARLGQRVRIAAGAELGGTPQRLRHDVTEQLYRSLQRWFPGAAQMTRPQVWKGARATLTDGVPLIGPGPHPGIWLNVGHGGLGWTLAFGSARRIADMVAGRTAEPGCPPQPQAA